MDIVLHVVRRVVLNDELELLDVEAARGDGCGNDDRAAAVLEVDDGLVAVDLLASAVQRHARVVLVLEVDEQLVGRLLALDKDERARVFLVVEELAEQLEQAVEAGVLAADLDNLGDRVGNNGAAADRDLERTSEDLAGERLHLSRERGGEEDCLAVGADLADDLHDLRLEAHVEHAVCLVQNEIGHPLEVNQPARVGRQELDHSPGRADDDFGSPLHVGDVVLERHAAVRTRRLYHNWSVSQVS